MAARRDAFVRGLPANALASTLCPSDSSICGTLFSPFTTTKFAEEDDEMSVVDMLLFDSK
jgi:hypothetical protein